jgi:alpha-1,2-mannosyltransferase
MSFLLKPALQAALFIIWGFILINLILLSAFTFFLLNICLTTFMIWLIITLIAWTITLVPILKFVFIPWHRRQCRFWTTNDRQCRLSVAFFHPYCNDGGGGERVLWSAIESILKKYKNEVQIIIYTGDVDATPEEILHRVKERFNMNMQIYKPSITFIYLRSRFCVEAKYFKLFTLLGQSIGSMILGFEALVRFVPDIYIDSMGYAFTYPLFRYLASVPIIAYVHYPTISTDMLEQVRERRPTYNNRRLITNSSNVSQIKLIYYRIFAYLYGWCGKCAQMAYCNSSWTQGHIERIWALPSRAIHLVYPPCDVKQFLLMPLVNDDEQMIKTIVSVGQFRPEKDHELQIRSFHELLQRFFLIGFEVNLII